MMLETDMSGPLAGIRVIDLTVAVLGPVATQILGDLGAEIIKIEPPEGEMMRGIGPARNPGMAAYYLNVNRNKKSVVLDLKQPRARDALLRLAATADVFVHNMRPGAAERLGIDYAAIAAVNRRIVYAWASGCRKDGPERDRAAFDDVIRARAGSRRSMVAQRVRHAMCRWSWATKCAAMCWLLRSVWHCSTASGAARARRSMCRC